MIDLAAIDQSVFDRANSDTAEDVPCILLRAGDYRKKLTIAEACDLFARLGGLLAGSFESAKTSLRARGLTTAREVPAPTRPRSPLADDLCPADRAEFDAVTAKMSTPKIGKGRPGIPRSATKKDGPNRSALASFIRVQRRSAAMTQQALAKKARLSSMTIWALENDLSRGTDDTLNRIADALGVESRSLFELEVKHKKAESDAA